MVTKEKAAHPNQSAKTKGAAKRQPNATTPFCHQQAILPNQTLNLEVDYIRHEMWNEALKGIENYYAKSNTAFASEIVALTRRLSKLLEDKQQALWEVLNG